jgi:hypothetical protein
MLCKHGNMMEGEGGGVWRVRAYVVPCTIVRHLHLKPSGTVAPIGHITTAAVTQHLTVNYPHVL